MKIRCITALGVGLLIVVSLAGCKTETTDTASAPPQAAPQLVQEDGHEYLVLKQTDVPGMTHAEVKNIPLPGYLETTGQVTFDDKRVANIVSRVQGRIEDIRASLWDNVTRGEPIMKLYSPDFMTAEAEYLQALTTVKVSTGNSIDGGVDLAASMATASKRKLLLLGMEESDINALKAPSPTIWMRAPITGTVVKNQAVRGTAINPGDVLYSLGTLDPIWFTADLYEVDLARVHNGQQLEAVVTAFPNEIFKGVIARVSPNIDPTSHTLQIRFSVPNPGLRLKPQMLARIKIFISTGNAVVVPREALIFDTDKYYAFVVINDDRIERRAVSITTASQEGFARVLAGLKPGERVVDAESLQVSALWHQAHGEGS